jgi:hypothetical protein
MNISYASIASRASLFCFVMMLASCQTAYYTTMEKFGLHKRDILVDRVESARNAQEQAKDQFKSALESFSDVLGFKGGELKEKYDQLSGEFKRSEDMADKVHKRIEAVESVAEALFDEWEAELGQYTSKDMRRTSQRNLNDTRKKYKRLIGAMKNAERRIAPVVNVFRDHVLFLKHNLNARAIASLRSELVSVKSNVNSLIHDMEASIKVADQFIRSMSKK